VDWIHLAQDRDQWQTQAIVVMNLQVHKRQDISWLSERLLGSQGYYTTNLFSYRVLSVSTNNLYVIKFTSFENYIFFKVFTVIVPITCKQKFNKWHAMIMGDHESPYSFLANICRSRNITCPWNLPVRRGGTVIFQINIVNCLYRFYAFSVVNYWS
jgi:hypothetical protein